MLKKKIISSALTLMLLTYSSIAFGSDDEGDFAPFVTYTHDEEDNVQSDNAAPIPGKRPMASPLVARKSLPEPRVGKKFKASAPIAQRGLVTSARSEEESSPDKSDDERDSDYIPGRGPKRTKNDEQRLVTQAPLPLDFPLILEVNPFDNPMRPTHVWPEAEAAQKITQAVNQAPTEPLTAMEYLSTNRYHATLLFAELVPKRGGLAFPTILKLRATCKLFWDLSEIYFRRNCALAIPSLVPIKMGTNSREIFSVSSQWLKTYVVRGHQSAAFALLNEVEDFTYNGLSGEDLKQRLSTIAADKYLQNKNERKYQEPILAVILGLAYKVGKDGRKRDFSTFTSIADMRANLSTALDEPVELMLASAKLRQFVWAKALIYEDNLKNLYASFVYPLETRLLAMFRCPSLMDDIYYTESNTVNAFTKFCSTTLRDAFDCYLYSLQQIVPEKANDHLLTLSRYLGTDAKAKAIMITSLFAPSRIWSYHSLIHLQRLLVPELLTEEVAEYLGVTAYCKSGKHPTHLESKPARQKKDKKSNDGDNLQEACIKLIGLDGLMELANFYRQEK